MLSKHNCSLLFSALIPFLVASCGGSGGGDDKAPATDPDTKTGTPTDNSTTPGEPAQIGPLVAMFPDAPAGPSGLLKDNLAGIWVITEDKTEHYTIPHKTTHSILRSIVRIRPFVAGSESNPFLPGMTIAPLGCKAGGIGLSQDPNTTQATFLENVDVPLPAPLNIVSDTRMERRSGDDHVIWQKIDVPTDANGDAIIGTITYDASGLKSFSGTKDIHCLTQMAEQTADGDDASGAPLLLTGLSLWGTGASTSSFDTNSSAASMPVFTFDFAFATEPATPSSKDLLLISAMGLSPEGGLYEQRFDADFDDVELTGEPQLLDAISTSTTNAEAAVSVSWQLNH